jgi:hypothetical protein
VLELQNRPTHCDSCNAKYSIDHALSCKKGGLVSIAHHNEVKDELGFLVATLATSTQIQSAMNHLFFLVTLQRHKAIVNNPIQVIIQNLLQIMKGIEVTAYSNKEFGNDRHTVLWMFALQLLMRDLIFHQPQRRFSIAKKWRRKRNIFRPVWINEDISLHSSAPLRLGCWERKQMNW